MVRNTAREIAIHLSYELSFTDKTVDALLDERLTVEAGAGGGGRPLRRGPGPQAGGVYPAPCKGRERARGGAGRLY